MSDTPSVLLLTPTTGGKLSPLSPFQRTQMPLLGLGHLAAMLQRAGIQVRVEEVSSDTEGLERLVQGIRRTRPTLIGLQVVTAANGACRRILRAGTSAVPDATWVVGGPHMVVEPEGLLGPGLADVAVMGEGEEVIVELAQGRPWKSIAGIRYVDGGDVIATAPRPLIEDLDSLPVPARHLLPRYRPSAAVHRRTPASMMLCSRGCPMRCEFCTPSPAGQHNQRLRSADSCFEELADLVRRAGIREVAFYDDLFFLGSRSHIEAFCERILREELDVTWWCQLHVAFAEQSTLELMGRAGCYRVNYGVESGEPRVLEALGKGISLARVERVLGWTREAKISSAAYFMLGNLGDTEASVRRTIRYAARCAADYVIFLMSQPLPGSPMYARAQEMGLTRVSDWSQFDGSQPTLRVPGLSDEFLLRSARAGWLGSYLRPERIARLAAGSLRGGAVQENVRAAGHLLAELVRSRSGRRNKARG